ncbi:hypothetical protein NC652_019954 [Populus alba x Populus x berolinensis]|nr:hypothetical protein NC652_019954 [Populus alba x Populus x berolinensis]
MNQMRVEGDSLCVGETLEQRESRIYRGGCCSTKPSNCRVSNWADVVLAYEPVWAIGTGKVATPAQAQECAFNEPEEMASRKITALKLLATTRIIYGGSVNGANCKELASKNLMVDGFLVVWCLL